MQIHQHNAQAKTHGLTSINLKGILVGNPATEWTVDVYPSFAEFAYMHNLMEKDDYEVWREDRCFVSFRDVLPSNLTQRCMFVLDDYVRNTRFINVYDIYRDYDWDIDLLRTGYTTLDGKPASYEKGFSAAQYMPWMKNLYGNDWEGPILGYTVYDYMNKPEVRKLLHISSKVGTWNACNNDPDWTYNLQLEGSTYIY